MQKIVKFKSVNAADRVQQHLYRVTKDVNRLIFSDFDKEAFELAVALEGLALADYSYVENTYNVDSARHTGFAPRRFRQFTAFVEFNLEAPEGCHCFFHLVVLYVVEIGEMANGCYVLPLRLDDSLMGLLQRIQSTGALDTEAQNSILAIMPNLESARLQFEPGRSTFKDCYLIIHGAGHSRKIGLDLTDFVFTVEREMYE